MPEEIEGSEMGEPGPYIQFALGEGFEPLRLARTDYLREQLAVEAMQAVVPVTRAIGIPRMRDCAVDGRAMWPAGNIVLPDEVESGYSVEMCFDRIERVLLADGAGVLRAILSKEQGCEVGSISEMKTTLVQAGILHGIFRVDVSFPGGKKSFAATIARDPFFNADLVCDYETMERFKLMEAHAMGALVNSPEFLAQCNVPRHHGLFKGEGLEPAFYLSDFLHGVVEVNTEFVSSDDMEIERRVSLNATNQGVETAFADGDTTEEVMSAIAAVLFKYSALTGNAFAAYMQAGDFMWAPGEKKAYWHTYKDPRFANKYFAANCAEISLSGGGSFKGLVAQLVQMLLQMEASISAVNGETMYAEIEESIGYPYTVSDVVSGLKIALSRGWISCQHVQDAMEVFCRAGDPSHTVMFRRRYLELMVRIATELPDVFIAASQTSSRRR